MGVPSRAGGSGWRKSETCVSSRKWVDGPGGKKYVNLILVVSCPFEFSGLWRLNLHPLNVFSFGSNELFPTDCLCNYLQGKINQLSLAWTLMCWRNRGGNPISTVVDPTHHFVISDSKSSEKISLITMLDQIERTEIRNRFILKFYSVCP